MYVARFTTSIDFPMTSGGAQAANGGNHSEDAFVARLNADLTVLHQATYLGGSSSEIAFALAIHPTSDEVYIADCTYRRICGVGPVARSRQMGAATTPSSRAWTRP